MRRVFCSLNILCFEKLVSFWEESLNCVTNEQNKYYRANVMNTLTPSTNTSVTSGQQKLLTRIIADVADSKPVQSAIAGLDKDGAERLKGNPEFAESLRQFAVAQISELSVTNQFATEERPSKYGYLSGYKQKGLIEQTNCLRELFLGIGYTNQDLLAQIEKNEVKLPEHAEGWFAIPNWTKHSAIFGSTYSQAVQKVLDTIKQSRGALYNYREGQIDEQHLRQSVRSQKFWQDISEAQGNPDILVVSAQFGLRHRGRSARRAREVFQQNEFGLGAFVNGIMILTHKERLMHYDDLWIDCSGDEFDDPGDDVRFDRAPCFSFSGGEVEFVARYVSSALDFYGSSSGLVPQVAEQQ